jgi:hypothetical protein
MYTLRPCKQKVSTKFFQKPRNCEATSASDVASGVPCENPVPTGLDIAFQHLPLQHYSSLNLLLNPDHVRQVDPRIGILDWFERAILPKEWAILLQEALQRAASGTTIQPDGDLVFSKRVFGGKEPEVKLPCFASIA